jgi:hypothetical protein
MQGTLIGAAGPAPLTLVSLAFAFAFAVEYPLRRTTAAPLPDHQTAVRHNLSVGIGARSDGIFRKLSCVITASAAYSRSVHL